MKSFGCVYNRACSKFQLFCHDACHSNGMANIWFTRLAQLVFVGISGKAVCFMQQTHLVLVNSSSHQCEDCVHIGLYLLFILLIHSLFILVVLYNVSIMTRPSKAP